MALTKRKILRAVYWTIFTAIMVAIGLSSHVSSIKHINVTLPDAVYETPIDRLLSKMAWGNIAFNSPKTMGYGETTGIQLLLSRSRTTQALADLIVEPGDRERYTILTSDQIEAHLIGDGFEIKSITAETQVLDKQGVTEWKWDVRPKWLGKQRLHLSLDAKLDSNGKDISHTMRTFYQPIDVKIVWPQSALFFGQNYWQWICTAMVLPFVGWAAARLFKSKPTV
jgi:hypothetical protein